jgi:hypothetical protein
MGQAPFVRGTTLSSFRLPTRDMQIMTSVASVTTHDVLVVAVAVGFGRPSLVRSARRLMNASLRLAAAVAASILLQN